MCLGPESTRVCAHTLRHAHTCDQGPVPGPQSACMAKRDTRQDGRPPSLSGHRLGDGQLDRQTGHSPSHSRHHLGDGWPDRPLCVGAASQTAGQTAARRPASSLLHIVCPQAPSCGRCSPEEPEWEAAPRRGSARHRRRAGAAGGSPAGWRCWHPAGTLASPLCLHGLNNTLRPCTVHRGNKHSGISFNRWRTIFFSPFNRHAEHRASQGPCAAEN